MDGTLPHCSFENLKPVEISKNCFNVIWTSLKLLTCSWHQKRKPECLLKPLSILLHFKFVKWWKTFCYFYSTRYYIMFLCHEGYSILIHFKLSGLLKGITQPRVQTSCDQATPRKTSCDQVAPRKRIVMSHKGVKLCLKKVHELWRG